MAWTFESCSRQAILALVILPTTFCCLGGSVVAGAPPGQSSRTTSTYFEQLRRRGLFNLAESIALQHLARETISPVERTEMTLELSRTFAEHAKFTIGPESTDLWRRAVVVVDTLRETDLPNPLRLQLDVQRALVSTAQGELIERQVELLPNDQGLREKATSHLSNAVADLQRIEHSLEELHRHPNRRNGQTSKAVPRYLSRKLRRSVQFGLCRALISQARLLPATSSRRSTILSRAEDGLKVLTAGAAQNRLAWESRLLLAETSRLQGAATLALRQLAKLVRDGPPEEIVDRATAEHAKLLLADRKPAEAAQLLVEYRKHRGALSGELRFLFLKSTVELWQVANSQQDAVLASQLFQQIENRAERAIRQERGYWSYRIAALLESVRNSQRYGGELARILRDAKAYYAVKNFSAAIETYGSAVAAARRSGMPELSMEFGYTLASIQVETGQYEPAAETLGQLVDAFPTSKVTAAASLLRAYCLGKLYESRGSDSTRQAYADALKAHRKDFAEDATAIEATWMLANLDERQHETARALQLYLTIPTDHLRGAQAQVALARCYERILAHERKLGRETEHWETEAITQLRRVVSDYRSHPERLTAEQAEVALRLARIHLKQLQPDYRSADQLLEEILARPPDESAGQDVVPQQSAIWASLVKRATQLRVISLAGQQRFDEASSFLAKMSKVSPDALLDVLGGLMKLPVRADHSTRRQLGELQLEAVEGLNRHRSKMSVEQTRQLDRCLAEAYAASKQSRRAIRVYNSLLNDSPRDKQLLRSVSELQVQCGTPECLKQAKANWRRLGSLEKQGSVAWLEARYQVAWCCMKLGQQDECRKLLKVTSLLYPGLGNPALRRKFVELSGVVQTNERK